MYQAGLVLEGGSTRGIFTAGVLDFLLERDLSRGEYAENNIPQICSHKLF